jgi:Rrf2 family transcriptional regulator, iron-sulfur cluster assembly transcription factor
LIYSSACEYAIRAASYLAARHDEHGDLVKLRDIAESEELPPPFLASILQRLVMSGLLRSARGPTGGYALERTPDRITLYDIKAAVDGTGELEACAVGLEVCSDEMPCPLHDTWKPIREQITTYLTETTLADMAAALEKKRAASGQRISGGGSHR